MKKIILIIVVVFSLNSIKAQFVVSDPGSYVYMSQNMLNTLETMYTSFEHLDKLKEGAEKLRKVTNKIKQGKLVLDTSKNIREVLRSMKEITTKANKIKNPRVRRNVLEYIKMNMDDFQTFHSLFKSSITSSFFEGNDLERIQLLNKLHKESSKLKMEIRGLEHKIKRY